MKRSDIWDVIKHGNFKMLPYGPGQFMDELDRVMTWDPEDSEVLGGPERPSYLYCVEPDGTKGRVGYRLRADGVWEYQSPLSQKGWVSVGAQPHPLYEELARRILEEHEQQEALDEHNDKLEAESEEGVEPFYVVVRRVNEHQERLESVSVNLRHFHSRLDALAQRADEDGETLAEIRNSLETTKSGFQTCLDHLHTRLVHLEDPPAHEDLGGMADPDLKDYVAHCAKEASAYFAELKRDTAEPGTLQVDYEEWKKLVAIWELWGPEGTLRAKLAAARYSGPDSSSGVLDWFRQLRSELLAVPSEFLFEEQSASPLFVVDLPVEGEVT